MRPFLKHLLLVWPALAVLSPALLTDNTWTFRDGGHFYRPLFDWLNRQARHGESQLWNPQDGLGAPVAGDGTSALFYPGRVLVAWLPVSGELRYELYVAAHLIGCALAAAWLAKRWGASDEGSVIAGVAYSLGGHVLFQVHNVPFLVGAAWLPVSLGGLWDVARGLRASGLLIAAPALALAILGGDPQSAVHAMLAGAMFIAFAGVEAQPRSARQTLLSLATLAGIALFAAMLGAVQIAPAMEHAAISVRAFSPNDPAALEFEVPLWRWIEFLVPNAGGRLFPFHERWGQALGIEGRVWSPSLYLGAIPALAIVAGVFAPPRESAEFRAGPSRACLLTLATFAMLAALGGPFYDALRWLPGYAAFRYPAKWAVFAAAPLAVLAAEGWERAMARPHVLRAMLVCISWVAAICLVVLLFLPVTVVPAAPEADPVFGRIGWVRVVGSWGMSMALLASGTRIAWALVPANDSPNGTSHWRTNAIIALIGVDLVIVHRWMTPVEPDVAMSRNERARISPHVRVARDATIDNGYPPEWRTGDSNRLEVLAAWERANFIGKTHLQTELANIDSQWTLRPAELATYREEAAELNGPGAGLACWGIARTAIPSGSIVSKSTAARVWVAQQVFARELFSGKTMDELRTFTRETLLAGDKPRDLVSTPVVETDAPVSLLTPSSVWSVDSTIATRDSTASARTIEYHNDRVLIEAMLDSPGLLVLADWHAPGWTAARIADDGSRTVVPILRVNRLLRGVDLPPGKWRVEFRYDPATVRYGRIVSLVGWTVWAIAVAFAWRQSTRGGASG